MVVVDVVFLFMRWKSYGDLNLLQDDAVAFSIASTKDVPSSNAAHSKIFQAGPSKNRKASDF